MGYISALTVELIVFRRYRGDSEAAAGVPHPAAEAGAASCREKAGQLRRRTEREDGQYTVHRVN